MKTHLLAFGLVLTVLAGSAGAQPRNAAELMPAETSAYVEIYQPRQIIRELRALAKGSRLEDVAATAADGRAQGCEMLGWLEAVLSPELFDEMADWNGVAFALTGLDKEGEPQGVAVFLTGKSHIAGIVARFLLAMSELHPVGKVEGVPMYRGTVSTGNLPIPLMGRWTPAPVTSTCNYRPLPASTLVCLEEGDNQDEEDKKDSDDKKDDDKKEDISGPTIALMRGAIIIGSSPDLVGDVIRRAKGKTAGATLAGKASFQEAVHLRKPGLFAYVDFPLLFTQLDQCAKESGKDASLARCKKLLNADAFRYGALAWWLNRNEMRLEAEVKLKPGQTSPLLDLLTTEGVGVDFFQLLPRDSFMTCAVAIPHGDQLRHAVRTMTELAQDDDADDESDTSLGEYFHKLGATGQTYLITEVLNKIDRIGVAAQVDVDREEVGGVWVVEAVDAEAARSLEKLLPQLLSNDPLKPLKKTFAHVGGRTIRSLPEDGLRSDLPIDVERHYGRSGKILVMGSTPEQVAAVLNQVHHKEGFASITKNAVALRKTGNACAVGTFSFDPLIQAGLDVCAREEKGEADNDKGKKAEGIVNFLKALAPIFKKVPPCVASLQRTEDGAHFVLSQKGLSKATAPTIDLLLDLAIHGNIADFSTELPNLFNKGSSDPLVAPPGATLPGTPDANTPIGGPATGTIGGLLPGVPATGLLSGTPIGIQECIPINASPAASGCTEMPAQTFYMPPSTRSSAPSLPPPNAYGTLPGAGLPLLPLSRPQAETPAVPASIDVDLLQPRPFPGWWR